MLTQGAMMIALFAILLLVTVYLPVIWLAGLLFLAFPLIWFSLKYPLKNALLVALGAVLISAIVGTIVSVPLALTFSILGLTIGTTLRKTDSKTTTFLISSLMMLFIMLASYVISVAFFHYHFIEELFNQVETLMNQSISSANQLHLPVDPKAESRMKDAVVLAKTLVPTYIILISFLSVFFVMWSNLALAKRVGLKVPIFPPVRKWTLPKSLLWYYLITYLLTFLVKTGEESFYATALLNALYTLSIVMLIQGFIFLSSYFYYKKWSKAMRIPVIILGFVPPFMMMILLLGIADLGMDLRKYFQQKPQG
jgi:uncharacterized protein YybS (DUF2232 family)